MNKHQTGNHPVIGAVLTTVVAGGLLAACGPTTNVGSGTPSPPSGSVSTTTSPPPTATTEPSRSSPTPITVTGVPQPGVEAGCLLLEGYLLIGGDRVLLSPGRTVTVTGHPDTTLASICQQGTPLVVDHVTAHAT
jgi:hypothetical protein